MKLVALLSVLALGAVVTACDDGAYVIDETEAKAIVREELELRGVDAVDTTRTIADVSVCVDGEPCRTIALALDGWDEGARVGFAYITSAERGLPHDTGLEAREADVIQRELDARVATEGTVVVFRQWAHETADLARDGFRRAVDEELDARGLTVPE